MSDGVEERFEAYVDGLAGVLGHADRTAGLRDYCTGLLLPLERKSVEPLAAATAPSRVSAQHQSLMHFVSQSAWSDERLLAKVRDLVLPVVEGHGPIEAWIIDDTGFRKQGRHSVGVARQYLGEIGKQDSCQVAVSLSLANAWASLPVAFQLYLPKDWAYDPARRKKAGVPDGIGFATKPQIALEQIRWAVTAGLPPGVALMDPGYGHDAGLREDLTALGVAYVAGVLSSATVWAPGIAPPAGAGRLKPGDRRPAQAISAKAAAVSLPQEAWRTIEWREGSNAVLSSRFARVRLYSAHRGGAGEPAPEWLLVEWPEGEEAPTKYWLATLPEDLAFERLGGAGQAALAHRARLPGPQAGTRPRPLRRPKLARLPSPRQPLHRRLRLPDLRAGDDSPLRTWSRPAKRADWPSRRLPTPRRRRSDPNGISPTRSPQCDDG